MQHRCWYLRQKILIPFVIHMHCKIIKSIQRMNLFFFPHRTFNRLIKRRVLIPMHYTFILPQAACIGITHMIRLIKPHTHRSKNIQHATICDTVALCEIVSLGIPVDGSRKIPPTKIPPTKIPPTKIPPTKIPPSENSTHVKFHPTID